MSGCGADGGLISGGRAINGQPTPSNLASGGGGALLRQRCFRWRMSGCGFFRRSTIRKSLRSFANSPSDYRSRFRKTWLFQIVDLLCVCAPPPPSWPCGPAPALSAPAGVGGVSSCGRQRPTLAACALARRSGRRSVTGGRSARRAAVPRALPSRAARPLGSSLCPPRPRAGALCLPAPRLLLLRWGYRPVSSRVWGCSASFRAPFAPLIPALALAF